MDSIKDNHENLSNADAIKKLKELAGEIRMCMFCTIPGKFPMETRPMSVLDTDENGNLWFMSSIDSNKNQELTGDNHVQLIFSDPGSSNFMTVFGTPPFHVTGKKLINCGILSSRHGLQKVKTIPVLP